MNKRTPYGKYVMVYHVTTQRAFYLNGGYELMSEEPTPDEIVYNRLNHVQAWEGWKPTYSCQIPAWAREYPRGEFIGFWIAE